LNSLIKTASFAATGSDGKTYQVFEWSIRIPAGKLLDASAKYDTMPEKLTLATGEKVQAFSPDEFEVLKTGVRLTRNQT
jgi:hypothetical protein